MTSSIALRAFVESLDTRQKAAFLELCVAQATDLQRGVAAGAAALSALYAELDRKRELQDLLVRPARTRRSRP